MECKEWIGLAALPVFGLTHGVLLAEACKNVWHCKPEYQIKYTNVITSNGANTAPMSNPYIIIATSARQT